jgi:hypothetical protein
MESSTVRIRPLRLAFLVKPSDKAALKRILEINSGMWGGLYNFIIPVIKTLPVSYRRRSRLHGSDDDGLQAQRPQRSQRCQLADFRPRMSRNFAAIDHALSANPYLYNQTHLLSVSFDPAYAPGTLLRRSFATYDAGAFTWNRRRPQGLRQLLQTGRQ